MTIGPAPNSNYTLIQFINKLMMMMMMMMNSGKTKTTGIAAISRLPYAHVW